MALPFEKKSILLDELQMFNADLWLSEGLKHSRSIGWADLSWYIS